MSKQLTFNEVKENQLKTLVKYVPVVDRVHGAHHPEFHEVRSIFETIVEKTKSAGNNKPELTIEFIRLREVTSNYKVPGDVCETYEAVYNILEVVDKAYHL